MAWNVTVVKLLVIYFYLLYIYLIFFFLTLRFRSLMNISQGTKQLTISLLSFLFFLGCAVSQLLLVGFLYLWWVGATPCCSAQASNCGGFSRCGAPSPGACGPQEPWLTGSVLMTHRLSCSMPCGTLPGQGLNPCPLHWQVDSYPLCHQRSSPLFFNAYTRLQSHQQYIGAPTVAYAS